MASVRLIKRGEAWVTEFLGKERLFTFDISDNSNWRSFGLHPEGAVEFTCDLRGNLETLTLCKTGEELTELEIPKNSQLAMLMAVGQAAA
jgi:hypothetical protein